jgi:hypothetical protein
MEREIITLVTTISMSGSILMKCCHCYDGDNPQVELMMLSPNPLLFVVLEVL